MGAFARTQHNNLIRGLVLAVLAAALCSCAGTFSRGGQQGETDGGLMEDGQIGLLDQAHLGDLQQPSATDLGKEVCGNGLDDDGDGKVDEGCSCNPATQATQACFVGKPAHAGVGVCAMGKQLCLAKGLNNQWGPCSGSGAPGKEDCVDGKDNDCNGKVDDGAGCTCKPGDTKVCYTGPSASRKKGICKDGAAACNSSGTGWDKACPGEVTPGKEDCVDGKDNDCNGKVDDGAGCTCKPGDTKVCYTGPSTSRKKGICKDGVAMCNSSGTGWSSVCLGEKKPGKEDCVDGKDNDCNGKIDDGAGCVCKPGTTKACYTGSSTTRNKGLCKDGVAMCNSSGTGWGKSCLGEKKPGKEDCVDGKDNDCNGKIDDGAGCVCKPGTTKACYTGSSTTRNKGLCKDGVAMCNSSGTGWGKSCLGEKKPTAEVCGDKKDNDCDGKVDEGCAVLAILSVAGDCVARTCPSAAPYPVGCNITMAGSDSRGCAASRPGKSNVYFKEGNSCSSGSVTGVLYCSSVKGSGLTSSTCKINKKNAYYPTNKSGCP